MTFTNTDTIEQAVKAFKQLNVNDQLSVLALAYSDIKGSLTSATPSAGDSKNVGELTQRVKDLRADEQVQFLQDVLSEKKTKNDEIALDPHPSQAMLELIPGGATPALEKYRELDNNSRLLFWYQFAQQNESEITSKIGSYSPSNKATELVSSLKNCGLDQKVALLNQIL